MSGVTRVLVVDDSAYVRKVVSQMLSRGTGMQVVGTARDGREALELVEELRPDVVTCDLVMPELDGVGFVQEQMRRRTLPIVIVSVANESGELVLAGLDAGAVDFVQKPTALATERLLDIAQELVEKVRAAAEAHARTHPPGDGAAGRRGHSTAVHAVPRGAVDVVVIGISTGGPQALKLLVPRLPGNLPIPVVIVLHMPVGYTQLYAEKLNEASAVRVREAGDNEPLEAGTVYIAPAGRHLTLTRNGQGAVTHLDVRPLDTLYRPSADVLFQSAADAYGPRVLAIVMTGMGSDGREGAAWIKAKGGTVYTEAEDSCVVYGMPRSVVEAGLSDGEFELADIADAILEQV
jgi:two-component system, chemotaxis family, protein-glutamate methylesterase/glutaminase